MLLDLHARLKEALRSTIRTQWNAEPPEIVLNQTPKIEFGELATPVPFELARQLKKPPRVIAEELIAKTGKIDGIERMEAAGAGYINFYLDRASAIRSSRLRGFPADEGKVIVEHTNINPNKAAHIGHLRNAAIGEHDVARVRAALPHLLVRLAQRQARRIALDDEGGNAVGAFIPRIGTRHDGEDSRLGRVGDETLGAVE